MPGWNASKPGSMSQITLETEMMPPDDNYDEVTGVTDLTPEEREILLWFSVIGLAGGLVLRILWGV